LSENDLIKCNYNYKEEMDLSTLTKIDLLVECAKLNINKCKSKTKVELIELINSSVNRSKQSNIEFIIEDNDDVENVVISSSDNTSIVASSEVYERDVGYLKEFLDSIRNKNGTYKRMCISPLRYAGGKSKAIGLILENLPKLKTKKIVSPFFGGGSMELCFAQELGFEVIGYDIFEMLANFWNTLIHFKDEFVSELKKFHINEEEFTYNRHVLLNYWEKVKPQDLVYKTKNKLELKEADLTLLDNSKIMQAVYYYYNMTLSYGPMFLGWPSSNEIDVSKFQRRIEKLEQMKLKNINVQCKRFEESLPLHKDDFLFLDPPYFLEGDSKMFKGMYPNCNFAIHHNNFDHKKLCLLLKEHRGGFLMTYNNCSAIRELYKDCKFEFPEWQYTYGQGETRIGKNREGGTNDNLKESHEIIIIKWPTSS
jgi:DNA adenine methylase